MSDSPDPLELPATTRRVRAVARDAQLPDAALQRALVLATESPDARSWRTFLSRTLALLGAGLILSGVVCFVAYNWDRIGRFGKFALLELAIVAAAGFAWRTLPKLSGEIALFSAAVLVGPLLALYGQTYQTGADPYGLFLTWFLLTLPWVVAARFSATWLLSLVLVKVALVLWWVQVLAPSDPREGLYLPLVLGALDFLALAAWQWQWERGDRALLTERWLQRLLGSLGLYTWLIPAIALVFGGGEAGLPGMLGVFGLGSAIAVIWTFYRARGDRFMLTIAVTAGMVWVTALAGRVMIKELDMDLFGFFVLAAFVIYQITLGLKWYRSMSGEA